MKSPEDSNDRRLWALHTFCNALPSGILAAMIVLRGPGQWAAMILVVLVFAVAVPYTPLWPIYRSPAPWGRAVRLALCIRSYMSCVIAMLLLAGTNRVLLPAAFEIQIGLFFKHGLQKAARLAHLHEDWQHSAWFAGALTLGTGLALLGVVGLLAMLIRGWSALHRWLRGKLW
jgi:hypothetical protein